MRTLKLLVTTCAFITYFIGMVGVSAVATGAIHSSLSARTEPIMIVGG
jgi:hypothetical protein